MERDHIIIVEDIGHLRRPLEAQLREKHENYQVRGFESAEKALDFITKIDEKGETLALVAADDRLGAGMPGHEFLASIKETHQRAKQVFYTGYPHSGGYEKALESKVDEALKKADPNSSAEGIFPVIARLLEDYERDPKLELTLENVVIKHADTLYERTKLFECRYVNYLGARNLTKEDLTEDQNKLGQEWDEFDNDYTRHIVAKMRGTIIGGVRIIDGALPMETAKIAGTDRGFSLDCYREQGYHTREISRLILDYAHRTHQAEVLLGLFRMISHLTQDHDYMFCTSREKQIGLYQGIGFELLNAEGKPITGEEAPIILKYKLKGDWYPMVRSLTKIREEPQNISGFSPEFHNDAIRQIERAKPEEWMKASMRLRTIAEETGYFTAFYVGNTKK